MHGFLAFGLLFLFGFKEFKEFQRQEFLFLVLYEKCQKSIFKLWVCVFCVYACLLACLFFAYSARMVVTTELGVEVREDSFFEFDTKLLFITAQSSKKGINAINVQRELPWGNYQRETNVYTGEGYVWGKYPQGAARKRTQLHRA